MGINGQVSVTNGQQFQIGHDDGFELMIGTWDFAQPGPTSYVLTTVTYTGASGNQPFSLAYGECCGAPAYLTVDLPLSSVPEPSTWAMLVLGSPALAMQASAAARTRSQSRRPFASRNLERPPQGGLSFCRPRRQKSAEALQHPCGADPSRDSI